MAGSIAFSLSQLTLEGQVDYLARKLDHDSDPNVRLVLRRSLQVLPIIVVAFLLEEAFLSTLYGALSHLCSQINNIISGL